MFGLFSKKKYKPTVTLEDKEWLEQNINWFIQVFGLEKLIEEPFIYPTIENFPYEDLTDLVEFEKLKFQNKTHVHHKKFQQPFL